MGYWCRHEWAPHSSGPGHTQKTIQFQFFKCFLYLFPRYLNTLTNAFLQRHQRLILKVCESCADILGIGEVKQMTLNAYLKSIWAGAAVVVHRVIGTCAVILAGVRQAGLTLGLDTHINRACVFQHQPMHTNKTATRKMINCIYYLHLGD